MHIYTQRLIKDAQSEGYQIDLLDDWDDIAELDRLAHAATNPGAQREAELLDRPAEVGGALLYRLSWGGIEWVESTADWFHGKEGDIAIAWAMSRGRDPEAFTGQMLTNRLAARKAVRNWARGLTCGYDSLRRVVLDLLPSEMADEQPQETAKARQGLAPVPSSDSVLMRLLAAFSGTDERYWLWLAPFDRVVAGLNHIREQEVREAMRWRAAAGAGRMDQPRDPGAPEQIAFRAWTRARAAFVAKLKARKGGGRG